METSSRRTLRGPSRSSQSQVSQFAVEPQRCSKSSATLFMHHRCPPASFGPSSKTWPRCEWQRAQRTSVRAIPCERSSTSSTASGETVSVKLGQPVPEWYFVGVHVLTGERALGRRFAQDGVLLRREPLAPLLVGVGQLVGRRIYAEPDRAAHAGPTEATVSVWDLVEVLLVVALGVVERAGGRDLRGNGIIAGTL